MSQDLISDQLRQFIAREPSSLYALAAECGLAAPVLSRFAAGKRSLSLESVDRIAKALGLRLVQARRRTRKP